MTSVTNKGETPRASLWLLVVLCALAPLSMDAMLPSIPSLTKAMEATASQGQLVITTFLFGFAFGQLIWGPFSDRFGRKPALLVGVGLFVVTVLVVIVVPNVWVVLSMRFVAGLTSCVGGVVAKALVLDVYSKEQQAAAIGSITSALFLAPSLGPAAGGFLQQVFGWRGIFAALFLLGIFLVVYIYFRFQETLAKPDTEALKLSKIAGNWWELLKDRHFHNPSLIVAFMSAGMFAFITGSPIVLMQELGLSSTSFGFAYMMVTVGFIAGSFTAVWLTRYFAAKKVATYSLILGVVAGGVLLAIALLPHMSQQDQLVGYIAGGFLFYLSLGLTQPLSMSAGLRDFPHIAGNAASLQGCIQMAFGTIASALVGIYFSTNMITGIGIFMLVCSVLSLLLILRPIRIEPTKDPIATFATGQVQGG